ncbi:MAG: glycosyltransferase [Candidatus Latescibacteria bacterium]|nr:glycosyltransferase [Candidatus Latescibacterota bacterium]NIO01045.1 glycosyltransferase [Candidatus Latescibacterota bacterium]NIO27444.1 glycosyltransferase [Candidatus Latescibacterota bacterium]NIO54966.1 glycosyltransferase [Candidatus Latescibacterota bacterium]NIT01055.1 glycosyltransferase [Candidatus Latescibacterota bacterium]
MPETSQSESFSIRGLAFPPTIRQGRHWVVSFMLFMFFAIIFLVCIYLIRHYSFTLNRLFGYQRQPYLDVDTAEWPEVTVLIPAHNEERVIGEILDALLDVDYPREKLTIMPINDRCKDKTEEIIGNFVKRYPDIVKPFHRRRGKPGKAAALNDAMIHIQTEIILVFDADYIPGRGLIKQLAAPFFDPEVGSVMGRVVPSNVECNLLTRLLDLERAGGYQVDQQARMNMHMVPQYGGTVGGMRKSALLSVGGWQEDSLAEDTDATYRLLLNGWKTVYQNRSECYEQVPDTWTSRLKQIMRWAEGHNQATARYSSRLLLKSQTRFIEKLDGLLLLGVYVMSPVLVLGWSLGIILWYLGEPRAGLIMILIVTSYSTLGNFAIFFEVTAAARLDGSRGRIRLLPFVFLGFLVSLFSVTRATLSQLIPKPRRREVNWNKTEHNNHNGNYRNNHNNNHRNNHGNHNNHRNHNSHYRRNG